MRALISARWRIAAGTLLTLAISGEDSRSTFGQDQDNARVMIVDVSKNVKDSVSDLADAGVTVIGRYFSRCAQSGLPGKRVIDNPGEIETIMADKRLNVFSIYQYNSRDTKFSGNGIYAVPRTKDDFFNCVPMLAPIPLSDEGQLDGYAAVRQAKMIHQPPGSAIYFGVDFDAELTPRLTRNVLDYFTAVGEEMRKEPYVVGAYGNGSVLDLLLDKKLIKFAWLSPSAAHQGSAATYNDKIWHMLQTKADAHIKFPKRDLEFDPSIQNPAPKEVTDGYIGFWRRDPMRDPSMEPSGQTLYTIPQGRNDPIHAARRFVCDGNASLSNDDGRPIANSYCTNFGNAVRIFEKSADGKRHKVDCNEDGQHDGWMKVTDLSVKRPIWIDDKKDRDRAHCPAAAAN